MTGRRTPGDPAGGTPGRMTGPATGAVVLLYRSELRRRVASWLAIALLLGIAAGAVMGAVSAGRRTLAAFPQFVDRYGWDEVTFGVAPVPPRLLASPEVSQVRALTTFPTPNLTVDGRYLSGSAANFFTLPPGAAPDFVKLLDGRLPSRPDEVDISYQLAQAYGLHPGSLLPVPFYPASQAKQVFSSNGSPPSRGGAVDLRVVGVEVNILDFYGGGGGAYSLTLSPSFPAAHPHLTTAHITFWRFHRGPLSVSSFSTRLAKVFGSGGIYAAVLEGAVSGSENAVAPQATGWWLLAALAGLATLAIVGQAFGRQALVLSEAFPTLRSLGAGPGQLVGLGLAMSLTIGVVAAGAALVFAWFLSGYAPVGIARVVEPTGGRTFDILVLVTGACATLAVAAVLGTLPVRRLARRHGSLPAASQAPSAHAPGSGSAVASAATSGLRRLSGGRLPTVLVGTRRTLDAGTGRRRLPVGTALFGTTLAVTALVATTVFGAGLDHLVKTPALYGRTWQLELSGPLPEAEVVSLVRHVVDTPGVDTVDYGLATPFIRVGKAPVELVVARVAKGGWLFPVITGRSPHGPDEIVVGEQTLSRDGAHIGSLVSVSIGDHRSAAFRVVGTTSFDPSFSSGGLGTGAVVTWAGGLRAICGGQRICPAVQQLASANGWGIVVHVVPGPAGRAAVASLSRRYAPFVAATATPDSLVNFGSAVNFPLLLGIILAFLGVATFAHLLVVTVARRRRDIGLLKALGFVRWQVAATVSWQATTVALVAVAFGVPLGVAVGRIIWHTFAFDLGAVPVDVVPGWAIAALAVGVVVVANLLALVPALTATRLRPAVALREP